MPARLRVAALQAQADQSRSARAPFGPPGHGGAGGPPPPGGAGGPPPKGGADQDSGTSSSSTSSSSTSLYPAAADTNGDGTVSAAEAAAYLSASAQSSDGAQPPDPIAGLLKAYQDGAQSTGSQVSTSA